MNKRKRITYLENETFGHLKVIKFTGETRSGSYLWECLCNCGSTHYVTTKHLKNGSTKSCGCLQKKPNKSKGRPHQSNLVGKIYNKLKVLSHHSTDKHQNKVWECLCDCGNITYVTTNHLNRNHTQSCGCISMKFGKLQKEQVYNYSGYKDITGSKWYSYKQGAVLRNLEFSITKEEVWDLILKQEFKCYYSGKSISFKDSTASIDRVDSGQGYNIDNIVIVHKTVNRMKNNLSEKTFLDFCISITNNIKKLSK